MPKLTGSFQFKMRSKSNISKESLPIFSIGHSTLALADFIRLLRLHSIDAIADVRSSPYSKRFPHFNRPALREALGTYGVRYAFLGEELGGRPIRQLDYTDGTADYEKMGKASEFCAGIDRLLDGSDRHRIAMMCSEQNPMDCHRCLLVGRRLADLGVRVGHILKDGTIQTQSQIEDILLGNDCAVHDDFFMSRDEKLVQSYRRQSKRVAYSLVEQTRVLGA